ncbi:MAG TPA: efflux RND transporter periplasmic adaptor subunit, partial [Erythrobacter sp.]|nr:efflux RND transporter periplasmic adaptor subunit [Erythrobacter sp.]HBM73337.1 efflux RND transporter periplasmic adaptor subunit [Erythrobacter sp.]HBQ54044.1 efflux RND transporter periplasmic adaptor subunit [Erythrobacter sp.]
MACAALLLVTACGEAERDPAREAVPVVAQDISVLPEQIEIEAIGSAR